MTLRRPCPRFVAVTALAVGVAASSSPARAQSASDQAAAEALFKQARDLMTAGHLSEACPKLAESQRLDPAPGTLLNLATCYEKNGQIASAWVSYKEAASAAQKANQSDRARVAKQKASELEAKLPTLTIGVAAAADLPDLQVKRDGQVVGRAEWGTPIPIDPGTHVVEASAPGRSTWQGQALVQGAGAKVAIDVPALEQATPAPATASSEPHPVSSVSPQHAPASAGSTQRIIGLVIAGAGIAGVAVGTAFGLAAKSHDDDASSHCAGALCDAQGVSALSDARSAATLSTIGFAAGGAALVGGVLLFLTAPRSESQTGVTVLPSVGSSAGGLVVRGAWR